ncbi:MAG: hypothetical protein ACOY5V_14030, partial [Pseudomonadota bacterium]
MRAAALTAFVAGVFLLQQRPELPTAIAVSLAAVAAACAWAGACTLVLRPPFAHRDRFVALLVVAGAAFAGFAYAATMAHLRMADELAFA